VSDYRTQGEVVPDGPEPLPKGPASRCRGCSAEAVPERVDVQHQTEKFYRWVDVGRHPRSPLPEPRACTPAKRVQVGTRKVLTTVKRWWFWARVVLADEPVSCREPGEHLHERCRVCGLEWLTGFAESL
jgi:hypothetical protein